MLVRAVPADGLRLPVTGSPSHFSARRASVFNIKSMSATWHELKDDFVNDPDTRRKKLVEPLTLVYSCWLDLLGLKSTPAGITKSTEVSGDDEDAAALDAILSNAQRFHQLLWLEGMVSVSPSTTANALTSPTMNMVLRYVWRTLSSEDVGAEPRSVEAKRQLITFVASLYNPKLRAPSSVETMPSLTALTPVYGEDIIYAMPDLLHRTKDGVNLMGYLQTQYEDEHSNFLERMRSENQGMVDNIHCHCQDCKDCANTYHRGLRDWATNRGQLLARTVRGVMQNNSAIRLLARLEKYPEAEINELVKYKFSYVVAAQERLGRTPRVTRLGASHLVTRSKAFSMLDSAHDPHGDRLGAPPLTRLGRTLHWTRLGSTSTLTRLGAPPR
ncbi:1,3-beta-glucan synthase [Cymbomonas tetramitiformis]|uniref:1,3-beta-glucan synthase n=1 Tax=Cymbomonas tetramitiformis TaxID=36881 RepID=A0AAE0B9R0_9CHLO|nr:1,3-beta-glucan synthase [Cymbomonas tetramitiformis]